MTGWKWTFAGPALNWQEALEACVDAGELPDYPTIANAIDRLWSSLLGLRICDAGIRRLWTSDEFDWYAAMASYVPSGDAGSVHKRELLPVVCVQK